MRKKCPSCGSPVFARENKDGMVFIDLQHEPNCSYKKACDDGIDYGKDSDGPNYEKDNHE